MFSWKRYIPEGTRDLMFEECSKKTNTISKLRELYLKSGFLEVSSPTIEFYDVFHLDDISIEQEKMYKLFDNTGRVLVLRPDMTIPIARIAATKLSTEIKPVRICYNGSIFRMNESWGGKFSEISQSGIEILGGDCLLADSEVIIIAIESLLSIGITDFEIELGEASFFKALINEIKLTGEEIEKLRKLIESKNFTGLKEFTAENKDKLGEDEEAIRKLPELFGGIDIIYEARKITSQKEAVEALDNLEKLYERLELVGLSKFVTMDLGMVQHVNYYTGMTFKAYNRKVGTEILSGGRYDNLISNFGESIAASGFGINIDGVMQALQESGMPDEKYNRYFITFKETYTSLAYKFAHNLRAAGYYAEISLVRNNGDCESYCIRKGIDTIIEIISEETLVLKDTLGNTSRQMSINDFLKAMEAGNEEFKNSSN